MSKAPASSFISGGMHLGFPDETYHVGLSVRTTDKAKGDRDQIEEAATQVMRGVNGLAFFLSRNPAVFEHAETIVLLPVIITTAKLWVTSDALSQADVLTGNIDPEKCAVKEVEWLYYQYPSSPGIKHDLRPRKENTNLSSVLQHEYVRTIAVVSAPGISSFLQRRNPYHLIAHEIGE